MGTSLQFSGFSAWRANYQLRAVTETPIASDICRLAERILHRCSMIRKRPAPHLMRVGTGFPKKIMPKTVSA
jgi:hypothetical protein